MKTQKVVNFPFKDFDPTAYLASVPQETILRHKQLMQEKSEQHELELSTDSQPERIAEESESPTNGATSSETDRCKKECLPQSKEGDRAAAVKGGKPNEMAGKVRARLESTSLAKTPIIDENLKDYHQHQLLPGQDPFDLKYQLYAVVVSLNVYNKSHVPKNITIFSFLL